jgi:hypothetical protein
MARRLGGRHRHARHRRRRRAVVATGSAAEAGPPAPAGSPHRRQGSPGARQRSRCPRTAGPEVGRVAVREAPSAPRAARPGPRDGRRRPQVARRGLPDAWRRAEGPWLAGPWGPPDPGRRPPAPGVARSRERRPVRRRTSSGMRGAEAAPVLDRARVRLEDAAAPGPDRVRARAGRPGTGRASPGPFPSQPPGQAWPPARQRPTPPPAPSPRQRSPPPEAHPEPAPSVTHDRLGSGGRSPGRWLSQPPAHERPAVPPEAPRPSAPHRMPAPLEAHGRLDPPRHLRVAPGLPVTSLRDPSSPPGPPERSRCDPGDPQSRLQGQAPGPDRFWAAVRPSRPIANPARDLRLRRVHPRPSPPPGPAPPCPSGLAHPRPQPPVQSCGQSPRGPPGGPPSLRPRIPQPPAPGRPWVACPWQPRPPDRTGPRAARGPAPPPRQNQEETDWSSRRRWTRRPPGDPTRVDRAVLDDLVGGARGGGWGRSFGPRMLPRVAPPGGRRAQPIGAGALPRRLSTTWTGPIPPAAAEG